MANRENASGFKQSVALKIQEITTNTTTDGEIIDMQGFDSVTFLFQTGTVTDGDYTVLIQEGDDSGLSDNTDVADAATITAAYTVLTDARDDAADAFTTEGFTVNDIDSATEFALPLTTSSLTVVLTQTSLTSA